MDTWSESIILTPPDSSGSGGSSSDSECEISTSEKLKLALIHEAQLADSIVPLVDCRHEQHSYPLSRSRKSNRTLKKFAKMKIGYFPNIVIDLWTQLKEWQDSEYEFILSPLIEPVKRHFDPICDLHLPPNDWFNYVRGYIWTEEFVRDQERFKFIEDQMDYCVHLGLKTIVIECPVELSHLYLLTRVLNSKLTSSHKFSINEVLLHVKVQSTKDLSNRWLKDSAINGGNSIGDQADSDDDDPWKYFDTLRLLCKADKRLGVALELNGDLPDPEYIKRWQGEPIKMIILPMKSFIADKHNSPVLPEAYQDFIQKISISVAREISLVVNGGHDRGDILPYMAYVDNLIREIKGTTLDYVAEYAKGFEDKLQIPLQPLQDNLETFTYDVFEKDPVKYEEYRKAVGEALSKLPADAQNPVVILLVGAGRGPLIRSCLRAAFHTKRPVHIYAVEKNDHAIITLKNQRWNQFIDGIPHHVDIVASDVRDWHAPKLADIVVSELLGSFGDNELSPECLDGVWKCVKPSAISIPCRYTSYIAPIMSHKLFSEATSGLSYDERGQSSLDCSYVVYLNNHYRIAEPKMLFQFRHENLTMHPNQRNNSRFATLSFEAKIDSTCHGFGGYFDTVLYEDITLSIVPGQETPRMFSWFPIWIPLQRPISLKAGDKIEVSFWRVTNRRAVWYEWCLTKPVVTQIQNSNGKSQSLGLY